MRKSTILSAMVVVAMVLSFATPAKAETQNKPAGFDERLVIVHCQLGGAQYAVFASSPGNLSTLTTACELEEDCATCVTTLFREHDCAINAAANQGQVPRGQTVALIYNLSCPDE